MRIALWPITYWVLVAGAFCLVGGFVLRAVDLVLQRRWRRRASTITQANHEVGELQDKAADRRKADA